MARHIIPISGKDSATTAIVQIARQPDLDYELVFNPTFLEVPAVHDWLKKVGDYLGKPITYVGENLADIIADQGILPSTGARFCTRLAKIQPLEQYLAADESFVYYGLRADEPERVGYQSRTKDATITPIYPLRELGINLPLVWRILEDRNLLTPFFEWTSVVSAVKERMGNDFVITESLQPWEYRQLFSWRVREFNCSFCMFMRNYEFVGLLDHYPDLFWHGVEIEESTGADGYTLKQGIAMRDIAKRADEIRSQRVKQICKALYRRTQMPLLDGIMHDELAATSCGMFCGK